MISEPENESQGAVRATFDNCHWNYPGNISPGENLDYCLDDACGVPVEKKSK